VLEWAKDENSVEAMREKTGKGFVKSNGKKQKIELDEDEDFEE
jgi:multiple RNA-binding domain-containing protein 1